MFILSLTAGLTLIFTFNISTANQISLSVGERAPLTIEAPRGITFISEVQTQQLIDQVIEAIFIYTPLDRSIGREQNFRARSTFAFMDVVRADTVADVETKVGYLLAIEELDIDEAEGELILSLSQANYNSAKNEILALINETMQQDIRPDDLLSARDSVRRNISFDLTPNQEQMVGLIAPQFVVPNVFFDEEATQAAREASIAEVQPVQQVITEGQTLIRVGEVVDESHLESLEQLGILQQGFNWYRLGANFMAALIASTVLTIYWWRFPSRTNRPRIYLAIWGILILIFALTARFMFVADLIYFFPMAALAMLLTTIADPRLSVTTTVTLAALVGFMGTPSLEMATYVATGGLIAGMTLRDSQRFYAFFRAGFLSTIGNMAVILIFRLTPTIDWTETSLIMVSSLANGLLLSPMLTIAGFFLVGLFGVTTVVQLQDLSRLDHPLLQQLLRRAPGTYHHSIMVANMAEQCAERIGANSTLVRVGAFYHDIGKMNRPPFFTENQENQGGSNPHDSLDPYTSARIIISHVTDGLEMAKQYRLPQRIQDFIAEHHGTRVIKLFYDRAKAGMDEEEAEQIDRARFQYPGPRPRSRETGLVLLADTVEAASRAMQPTNGKEIERLVNKLIDEHLQAGQLDESDLTMGDLQIIRSSFIETLKGRFHVRVRYPGNEDIVEQTEDVNREPVHS
ncbi:MAG: HDIG domain-containing protein [Ardenticatenaceae bacterium]|nr:HDIG domain-containing protein [Ardenticatenaceae bacterium]